MTRQEFLNAVSNSHSDILQMLITILEKTGTQYCVIGGLAVNSYVEPVVSLDIDLVITVERTENVLAEIIAVGWRIETFEHSINLKAPDSELRIQIQTDERYQEFIFRSRTRDVLGYQMEVAGVGDVLQGKVWAYSDETRRSSKRQKDLADIFRLVEAFPELTNRLPLAIRLKLDG
jgi:hypothetical protein